jgi:hypothetical protein
MTTLVKEHLEHKDALVKEHLKNVAYGLADS